MNTIHSQQYECTISISYRPGVGDGVGVVVGLGRILLVVAAVVFEEVGV